MPWLHYLAYFFAGVFLTNAIPHFVSGLMGLSFQTPLAKPPGKGLSTSTINVLWGFSNLVIAHLLIFRVGEFDPRNPGHVLAFGTGMLLIALRLARHFGRLHGGNTPEDR